MVIFSGGQTGVDRAAWDAALETGLEQDGWVPKGRIAEDGVIPKHYRCQEIHQTYYAARTVQNLMNADATLILCFDDPSGGTLLTLNLCEKHKRPHLLLNLEKETTSAALQKAKEFLDAHQPERLNVAGPRGSSHPDTYARARTFLIQLFQRISWAKAKPTKTSPVDTSRRAERASPKK